MDKLITMQIHLDDARRNVEELCALNMELSNELAEQHRKLYRTKINYRIAILFPIALTLWVGLSNMEYYAQNNRMGKQIADFKKRDLPQRFDNVLKELYRQNDRVRELEHANEQLIEHCEPRQANKAIKATQLPELVKGV